jgi:hypothetical protein
VKQVYTKGVVCTSGQQESTQLLCELIYCQISFFLHRLPQVHAQIKSCDCQWLVRRTASHDFQLFAPEPVTGQLLSQDHKMLRIEWKGGYANFWSPILAAWPFFSVENNILEIVTT